MPEEIIAVARSPAGRVVLIDSDAWDHVLMRHQEMNSRLDQVVAAIERPEHREPDLRPGRERFFTRLGDSAWLRVIIEFGGETDRVVTAFAQDVDPRPRGAAG